MLMVKDETDGTWKRSNFETVAAARQGGSDLEYKEVPEIDGGITSPDHYKNVALGIEVWDIIEAFGLGYRLGNVIKYILRAGKKGPPEQRKTDLQKAITYLSREIEKT